jgi:N-acetylglucosaminyl-diphospho-decaprenol L-rhamnosyltransferase
LEQCLYAVLKACKNIEAEICVIDNNSTDDSKAWLENKFPSVLFNWQTTNHGFGKANNIALKQATGDYILFLNPDTIIAEDTLELCLNEMKKDTSVGALGVRMIDGSGKFLKESKRGFPSAAASFFKMSGMAGLFPRSKKMAAYYAGHLNENDNHIVDVLAGAFMMLSRKAVEITKGFDEDFFMYGEDVDLSYRIQQAGLKNIYFAGTTIIHFKGESTQKFSASYNKHFYGAMRLFVKKHFADKRSLVFFTGMAIGTGKIMASFKSLRSSAQNNPSSAKPMNTAIAAGQQKFDECLHLVKYASPPLAIKGRIAVKSSDAGTALGRIDNIKTVIAEHTIEQLIFCEGEQDFKDIIRQAQTIPSKTMMLFHAQGSNSIVGSNNKNTKGKFIAKP